MYHAEFKNAKNSRGERYRDNNGNPILFCFHRWIIHPKWRTDINYHAGFIPQNKETFYGFDGICEYCGECIFINHENVLSLEEYERKEKELEDELRRLEKPERKKKNV